MAVDRGELNSLSCGYTLQVVMRLMPVNIITVIPRYDDGTTISSI